MLVSAEDRFADGELIDDVRFVRTVMDRANDKRAAANVYEAFARELAATGLTSDNGTSPAVGGSVRGIARLKGVRSPRLLSAVHRTGISYCDRAFERHGDYLMVGFLDFSTLKLVIYEPQSPLVSEIRAEAAVIQAARGEPFEVSTCGQTVSLGSNIQPEPVLSERSPS